MFHNLCNFIKDEMTALDRKAAGGNLSMQELDYADKLSHIKKSILTIDAMENPEEYGYSEDRHYSSYGARGRRRDSMGRYSDSRMYRDDNMMGELRDLMEKAPNEQVKRKYREFISDMESMM